MPGSIITVKGRIESGELGFCQPHEHLFTAAGPWLDVNPALLIDDKDKSLADAIAYARAGGSAVVDAQPVFIGRDARALKYISEASGVHIIASTGFHNLFYYEGGHPLPGLSEAELAELFISEILDGMYAETHYTSEPVRTDIQAGQIKAALETDFTGIHKKLFTAVAEASKQTGVPVMIHVDRDADPLMILDFMTGLGVAPSKQIFCHLDRAIGDVSVHKKVAGAGAFIEYDTIARPKYHDNETEIELILMMLDAGFEDYMLMAMDTTRARMSGYGGKPGLDYILREFIPELAKRGVDKKTIGKVFIDNPVMAYSV